MQLGFERLGVVTFAALPVRSLFEFGVKELSIFND